MRKEIVDMRRKTYIINNIAVGRTVVSMQIGFAKDGKVNFQRW